MGKDIHKNCAWNWNLNTLTNGIYINQKIVQENETHKNFFDTEVPKCVGNVLGKQEIGERIEIIIRERIEHSIGEIDLDM